MLAVLARLTLFKRKSVYVDLVSPATTFKNETACMLTLLARLTLFKRKSVYVDLVSPANTLKNEKACMLTVLSRLTHWKTKNKKSSVLLSWFSGTPYTGTQQNRSDKMHHQPAPASQALLVTYLRLFIFRFFWSVSWANMVNMNALITNTPTGLELWNDIGPPIETSSIDQTQQSRFTWWRGKSHPSKRCGYKTQRRWIKSK
jgi:hypothetical protein